MTPQQLYDYVQSVAGPDDDWREYMANAAQMIRDQARRIGQLEERLAALEVKLNEKRKAVAK